MQKWLLFCNLWLRNIGNLGNPSQPECSLGECSTCMCSNTNVEGGCNFCNENGNAAECVNCSKLPQLKASSDGNLQ